MLKKVIGILIIGLIVGLIVYKFAEMFNTEYDAYNEALKTQTPIRNVMTKYTYIKLFWSVLAFIVVIGLLFYCCNDKKRRGDLNSSFSEFDFYKREHVPEIFHFK